MQTGTLEDENETANVVKAADQTTKSIPKNQIFRDPQIGSVRTALYGGGEKWTAMFYRPNDKTVREFLNGGAILSSLPDFLKMDSKQRIRTLSDYVTALIQWKSSAKNFEEMLGTDDLKKVIIAGAAVCRHLAPILGAILGEAGFETKMVSFLPPAVGNIAIGHAWLEVVVRSDSGSTTFIVDPSNGLVMTMEEVMALQNPTPFVRQFYLNPDRVISTRTDLNP